MDLKLTAAVPQLYHGAGSSVIGVILTRAVSQRDSPARDYRSTFRVRRNQPCTMMINSAARRLAEQ
jgi:hypothetical protein